jgi:hypothetical protein
MRPFGKELYSSPKGLFVLIKTKKISGLYESIDRDIEMYIPDTYRV